MTAKDWANTWLGKALMSLIAAGRMHAYDKASNMHSSRDSDRFQESKSVSLSADNIECLRQFVKKMNEGRETDIDSFFAQVCHLSDWTSQTLLCNCLPAGSCATCMLLSMPHVPTMHVAVAQEGATDTLETIDM